MDEYGMNEFEMIKKEDVMSIINAENAVVLNNLKERSTDEVLCAIASQINGLQTIEPKPVRHGRWIPVEDALPDALQNVLVCTDINTVTVAWINGDGWTFADTGNGHTENWSFADVKYWMHLPEPPKGEQK